MSELASALKVASPEYQTNRRAMIEMVDQLRSRVAEAGLGGGASARARHVARGKLLPRARVELLLDPGSPFLEFSQLVAYGLNDDEATAHLWDDGVIDPKDTHTSLGLGLAASLSAPIPAIRFSVFRM